jgi:DNA repair protein RecO (recombination protein O)
VALITTEGVVLKTQRLGETDKLLTLFTADRGKLKAVAKGARSMRTRFGGALEPFTHCRFVLFEKKPGLLARLNHADPIRTFAGLRTDLERIQAAFRMSWLVSALTPEAERHASVLTLLLGALDQLDRGARYELTGAFFQFRLLREAGFLPCLDRCVRCQGDPGPEPLFAATAGGLVCRRCRAERGGVSLSAGTLGFLARADRLPWSLLERHRLAPGMLAELAALLETHTVQVLGRPLPALLRMTELSVKSTSSVENS